MTIPTLDTFTDNGKFIEHFAQTMICVTGSLQSSPRIAAVFVRDAGEDYEPEAKVTRSMIRKLAAELAAQANEGLAGARWLYKEIMSHSGIKPYKNDYLIEEFKAHVPAWYRRKAGLTPDEMADELGFSCDTNLYSAIDQAEMAKKNSGKKGKKWLVKDFLSQAKEQLEAEHGITHEVYENEYVPF